jgi:localization factor PodJL
MMKYVRGHVSEVRPAARDAAGDAARRSGFSVGAAFAMIRKDIQELRRQASRPHVEPAVLEQRLHEIGAQIDAIQSSVPASRDGSGPGMEEFVAQLQALLAQNETKLAALQQQIATTAATAISGPAESIRRDVASLKEIQASVDRRTQETFEAVYDTVERIVDRLATLEVELRDRPSGGAQSDPSPVEQEQRAAPSPRLTPPSEVSALPEGAGMSIMLRQPAAVPDHIARVPAKLPPVAVDSGPCPPPPPSALSGSRFVAAARRMRGKAAVAGVGMVLAMLFALTFALDFYRNPPVTVADALPPGDEDRTADVDPPANEAARPAEPSFDQPLRLGATEGSGRGAPATRGSANPFLDGPAPAPAASDAAKPDANKPDANKPDADVSPLMRNVLVAAPAGDPWRSAPSPAPDLTATPLPPAIGGRKLVEAAAAGDPDASYEIAIRFAQGRHATLDFAMAAAWLDRAARAGLAPAQFRLGSMYEKGLGVRKDFVEARRLYVAAAAKGHAKAMHNLAVLYTGGIDGEPDFAAAAEWFRKAAAYGIVDSEYNLGILCARGSGVERDLAESYKWFALAAKGGDRDAVHKRDEVARGLDPKHLESARQAVEAFVATPQPDEATAVKAPPGGWDHTATAATTKSRPVAKPERFPGR